jgi:phosphoesterase RecJ-like protein
MAKCLYVAVASDTGCFKFSNVTAITHSIGAKLYEIHGNFYSVNYELFDCRTMDQIKAEREVLETLEFFRGNKIAVIAITNKMRERTNTTEEDTDYFAQIPRRIKGVEVGITLKENGEGSWRISLRTNGVVDASQVCETLGGGGHARAAGARMNGSFTEVKNKVIKVVQEALDSVEKP